MYRVASTDWGCAFRAQEMLSSQVFHDLAAAKEGGVSEDSLNDS